MKISLFMGQFNRFYFNKALACVSGEILVARSLLS